MNDEFAPARAVRVTAALALGAEAALLALSALLYVVLWAVGEGPSRELSLGLAAIAGAAAVGLGFLARALWRARRWAVSPSLTWQVLQGFVGAYFISVGDVVFGAVAVALAVVGGVALVVLARGDASAGE